MSATTERMTVEEYFEVSTEGDRTQLVDGAIVVNDEPRLIHAMLQGRIFGALFMWVEEDEGRGIALFPTPVVVSEHDAYGPDILWVSERRPAADATNRLALMPDLCVEVRSPSTWRYDVGPKKAGYERAGLPELWLVDYKADRVLVFRRTERHSPTFDVELELHVRDELTSPLLPGFALSLEELFRR
jgi:Uma2 family endonuclease